MPDQDIDLAKFNEGDYQKALAARHRALEITQASVWIQFIFAYWEVTP
jgi:hypothetical protein